MPVLIDGHNLIGQMRDLSLSDPDDEAKLIRRLQAYATRRNRQVTVVFDPSRQGDVDVPRLGSGKDQRGSLTVIYAPARSEADDIIREIVGDTRDRQGLIVVTSDAAVAGFTHACGLRVQSSQSFIREMNRQLAGGPNMEDKPSAGKAEVSEWANVFKEPEPIPKPASPHVSIAEMKRRKRAAQLKRQAGKRLLF